MTKNQILVQNIETFETITRLTVDVESGETATERIDQYFSKNSNWGIVSLDDDADGEYMSVLLVAPAAGPDFEMDMATGEMEPVETVDPDVELACKLDIAMEIDNVDEEFLLALETEDALKDAALSPWLEAVEEATAVTELKNFDDFCKDYSVVDLSEIASTVSQHADTSEATITTAPSKPRNKRKSRKSKTNTQSQGKTMKNHEILAAFISANPGVTRAVVFSDAGLQGALRSPAQVTAIGSGDKQETKRWNSCINRFIRKIRRDGTDIRVNGMGKTATYSIGTPSGQLELPFNDAAEARNAAIIGDDANEAPVPSEKAAMRLVEEPNQSLDFEALLATLDEDEATITSDDQVAFKAAQEMIK